MVTLFAANATTTASPGAAAAAVRRRLLSWSSSKSPFEILGVQQSASDKEIKRAYLDLAKKYHPDTNKEPNAANKFKEISAAYDVLSSKEKRDQFNAQNAFRRGAGGSGGGFPGSMGGGRGTTYRYSSNINPEDIFKEFFNESNFGGSFTSDFFGQQERQKEASRSQTNSNSRRNFTASRPIYEHALHISFADSIRGITKEYRMNVQGECSRCRGNGEEPGVGSSRCEVCAGAGYVTQTLGRMLSIRTLCSQCQGQGRYVKAHCSKCAGRGRLSKTVNAKVIIPAGTVDSQVLRVEIDGCEALFTINVGKSQKFWREGKSVHSYLDIGYTQACLGSTLDVEGIHSPLKIRVPPGSSSADKITISGQGVVSARKFVSSGDHILHVRIKTPKTLTERQKALVMALAEEENNSDSHAHVDGLEKNCENRWSFKTASRLLKALRSALCPDQIEEGEKNNNTDNNKKSHSFKSG